MIARAFLDRFAAKNQGCYTLAQLLDFDHFNDYKDTLGWLRGLDQNEHLATAIDYLEVSHWIWTQTGGKLPISRGWNFQ